MRGGHLLKIRELGIEDFSTHKDTILEMLMDSASYEIFSKQNYFSRSW